MAVLAGGLAALLGSLALRVVLARALDPAGLGLVLLGIAIVTPVGIVAGLGLNAASARRISERRARGEAAEGRAAARGALALAALSGAAASVALLAAAGPLGTALRKPGLDTVLRALAPVAAGLAVGSTTLGIARAWEDVAGRALVRDAGGGLLRVLGVGAALLAGSTSLAGIALGYMAGSVAAELLFAGYGAARGWLRRDGAAAASVSVTRGLAPYAFTETLAQGAQWLDLLVLGAFAPPSAVGLYGVARGLTKVLDLVRQSAGHRFLPSATVAVARGDRHLLGPLWGATRLFTFALAWTPLAVFFLAPAELLALLFGSAYAQAAPLLRLLAGATLVSSLFDFLDLGLLAENRPERVFQAGLGGLLTLAGLLVLLVPRLGAAGAALALLAAGLVKGALLVYFLPRGRDAASFLSALVSPILLAVASLPAAALLLHVLRPGAPGALVLSLLVGLSGTAFALVVFARGRVGRDSVA